MKEPGIMGLDMAFHQISFRMSIAENSEKIREWTDKFKSAGPSKSGTAKKLKCAQKLNSLWLQRETLFNLHKSETPFIDGRDRGYASGMAEGWRIIIYMLRDELEEM